MTSTRLRTGILTVSICLTLTADRVQQDRRQVSNGDSTNLTLTPEQAEVWNGEQDFLRYLQSRNLKKFMSLWDDRFVGWPDRLNRHRYSGPNRGSRHPSRRSRDAELGEHLSLPLESVAYEVDFDHLGAQSV